MMKNRYIGTLIGCAMGDTLGMPVEGWKREQIQRYWGKITEPVKPKIILDSQSREVVEDEFGKLKYWFKGLDKGDYTDDTILTISLAKSLLERGFDLDAVAKGQLSEYEIRQRAETGFKGGFGGTTVQAFERLKKGISPIESGVIGGPGNGPAMKMSPVGLHMHATNNYEEGLKFAEKVSRITHLDPRSVASGVLHAHAIYSLLNDIGRVGFVSSLADVCERFEDPLDERFTWHKQGSLLERLKWIKSNMDADDESAYQYLGVSSAVYRSYPFALFMFQKYWENSLDGLIATVNQGGDSDTIGAIYGTLAGAKNGTDVFPAEWIEVLKGKDRIIQLGERFFEIGDRK